MPAGKRFIATTALSLFFWSICQVAFAQENFLPGYIIPLHGDTLHGLIDYRNWDKNPDKIAFKEKPGDAKSIYSPLKVKAFGVLDETYESAVVETETSPTETKELGYDKELVIKLDTAFLQAVVKGEKSLYYYKNRRGKEQFYIREDSSFKLLVYKKYLEDVEGQSVIAENNTYIGQLTIYLLNCSTIQIKLKGTVYRKNSLEDLFLSYYKCTQTNLAFHKKTEKTALEFGVLAGVSLTSLKFASDGYEYLVYANYNTSVNFSGGMFFDVILSRNRGKWSINNELIFTTYKVDGQYELYTSEDKYSIAYTTLGYSYLKLNNMVRFKYPVGKFFIYVNGGISNGYAILETNYAKTESKLFTQVRVEEMKALNDTRRYELGFIVGLGVKYKKFSLETRFENGNGMSVYQTLKSSTYRYYGLLGYRF